LNNRRKAKKPVMPIPRRAIEVGSGTAAVFVTTSDVFTAVITPDAPEKPRLLVNPTGPVLDSNVHTNDAFEVGANVTVTVSPLEAIVPGPDTNVKSVKVDVL
jgi:hypothetical protein